MGFKISPLTLHLFLVLIFISNCSPHLDYFGNNINLDKENIYLSDLRNEKNDTFLLVFRGKFNKVSKNDMLQRELTLDRYIKLIKSLYGYNDSQILEEESFGVIAPRYYIKIKFK